MTNKRVLVVSTSFARATSHPLRVLEEHGCEVVRIKGPHSEAKMAELVPGFAAVIVGIGGVKTARGLCSSEQPAANVEGIGDRYRAVPVRIPAQEGIQEARIGNRGVR